MSKSILASLAIAGFVCIGFAKGVQADDPVLPNFRAQTIDSKIIIGYGTAIGDVNGDGKPDILLADKKQFVWYENPSWARHVLAENLTEQDNVCIAARDIDGDGKVEIAVGGQWNPGDTVNSGSVHYLVAPADRTQMWAPIELQHEPVVHRMRWVKLAENKFVLVVAPLHGRGNQGGEGVGAKLLAYTVPNDIHAPWPTETLDDSFHVTHNFDVVQFETATDEDSTERILYYGREGAKLISYDGEDWNQIQFNDVAGGGEIRLGRLANGNRFLATIEPFHGTELVFYPAENKTESLRESALFPRRIVLDKHLNQGHAVATADLIGNGSQQIVAGWREPNDEGKIGIKLYYPTDERSMTWNSEFIDDNTMACEDLRIADLNGDGRPDIIACGRSTHNLKIYWNEGHN